ncbi:unnamed protein product [Calypogeia fissa]
MEFRKLYAAQEAELRVQERAKERASEPGVMMGFRPEFRKLHAPQEAKGRAKAGLAAAPRRVMLDSRILRAARQAERDMQIAREEFEKEEKEKQWNTMYIGYNEEELKPREKCVCTVKEGIFYIPDKPRKKPELLNGTTEGAEGGTSKPQVQEVRPTRRPNADEGENNHFFFGSLYEMVERDQKNFTHWKWVGDRWEGRDI